MTLRELLCAAAAYRDRAFAPREIFLRSGDRFRHIRISPWTQKAAAAVLCAALAWGIFASGRLLVDQALLMAKDQEVEQHKLAYLDLLSEVAEYHRQFAKITRDLQANQTYLLSVLVRSPDSRQDLAAIQSQLKDTKTEQARVVIAREELREKAERLESDLRRDPKGNVSLRGHLARIRALIDSSKSDIDQVAAARERLVARLAEIEGQLGAMTATKQELDRTVAGLRGELTESEAARRQLLAERAQVGAQIAGLQRKLERAGADHARLEDRITSLSASLAEEIDRGTRMASQRDHLQRRVGGLEQRLVDLRDAGQTVIERLSARAKLSVEVIEKTIEMTGLDIERLLASAEQTPLGQGGPFVPASAGEAADFEPSIQLEASVVLLDQQLDRWTALRDVVRRLPLSAPLDEYRISSGFGERKDPVNGRKARHQGIDFAAPMRSAIYATAPGKVVFAGWRGRYGRTIEIDHGHGIRTRYGHLHKILVKVGQEVTHREKIAQLGSSGRSTGPHVHYEIQFKGRPQNPMQFLLAGEHVFKS